MWWKESQNAQHKAANRTLGIYIKREYRRVEHRQRKNKPHSIRDYPYVFVYRVLMGIRSKTCGTENSTTKYEDIIDASASPDHQINANE